MTRHSFPDLANIPEQTPSIYLGDYITRASLTFGSLFIYCLFATDKELYVA